MGDFFVAINFYARMVIKVITAQARVFYCVHEKYSVKLNCYMIQGIILAGGFSSRAESNKMHFAVNGKPILLHTIESIIPFVEKVIVVTGYYDQDIRSFIKEDEKIKIIYNKDYEKGMFSSVKAGVEQTTDDFFILPGDIPFIKRETFEALIGGKKKVRIPTYQGKEGHPLFISKELKEELLNESLESNLRVFRDRQDKELIPVNDKNILRDIDTKEQYEALLAERKTI